LTYLFNRPLESLEENLQFITWLGIIYNTYWDHLVYSNDTSTVHKDLDDATTGAIERLKELIDNHAARSKNRTRLVPQQTALPDAQNTGSPDGGK